jgi:hypothetical protein
MKDSFCCQSLSESIAPVEAATFVAEQKLMMTSFNRAQSVDKK